jgi:hypothetical protein
MEGNDMPLYDITTRPMLVQPPDAANYDLLQRARKDLGEIRFKKDCRIIDEALDRIIREGQAKNKLVFTKAGFLVGHSTKTPHVDVQHVWDSAELAYPCRLLLNRIDEVAGEMQLKFVGGLVRWRISMLPDTWLVYRQPTDRFNTFTGKEITVSEYWINNDFVFQTPPKRKNFSMMDLKSKFEQVRA